MKLISSPRSVARFDKSSELDKVKVQCGVFGVQVQADTDSLRKTRKRVQEHGIDDDRGVIDKTKWITTSCHL